MENPEQNDPVWDLLESAKTVDPSPFFARNVVREVRLMENTSFGVRILNFMSIRSVWTSAASASVAAALVAGVVLFFPANNPGSVSSQEIALEEAFNPALELEEVEYLGQLMAVADPGQLTDEALADLFF